MGRMESKIQDIDIRVITATERHKTLERLMGVELKRIGDEVARMGQGMAAVADKMNLLSEKRNGDLRTLLGVTWSILITVLGSAGWFVLSHILKDVAKVVTGQ